MDVIKINWSGGKDSTASVILHIQERHKCIVVCYIPMLTKEIPLIAKEHYEFIMKTADVFRVYGCEVHIITGKTYVDLFYEEITRGKNKGKIRGYNFGIGFCNFRDLSKIKALESFICKYDYLDIGIAYDEVKRQNQLNDIKRSILVEKEITEEKARMLCEFYDLLSPIYKYKKRDGCLFCPNAKSSDIGKLITDYPKAREILINLDKDSELFFYRKKIKDYNGNMVTPYRNYKTFTDRINEFERGETK